MPDVHPDAPNAAVEAAARAIGQWLDPATWLRADNDEVLGPRHWEAMAKAVIQVLVDGGHYVPKETRAYTMALQAERDAALARAEAAEAERDEAHDDYQALMNRSCEAIDQRDTRLADAVDLLRRAADHPIREQVGSLTSRWRLDVGAFLAVFDNPVTPEAP